MSTAEPVPHLPPEFAVDDAPLSDDDLARYFDADQLDPQDRDTDEHDTAERIGGWRIEDDDQAEWALRKMLEAEDQLRVLNDQLESWLAPIKAWHDRTTKRPNATLSFFTERLEDYAVRRQQAGGPKTLPLPSGTLKVTESKPCAEVADDDELAAQLTTMLESLESPAWTEALAKAELAMDDLVRVAAKVYVGPLRKLVTVGEVPDGNVLRETYSCGHWRSMDFSGTPEDVPGVGESVECSLCEPDPIDGYPTVAVVEAEVMPRMRWAVLGPDGQELPGAVVNPGGLKPKVVLGR